jgi:hypothetical protein
MPWPPTHEEFDRRMRTDLCDEQIEISLTLRRCGVVRPGRPRGRPRHFGRSWLVERQAEGDPVVDAAAVVQERLGGMSGGQ